RTNLPTLEAELYDGSGTVTLVWLGRRRIGGVEPGTALTVRGRVALRDGEYVIYNPHYELRPGPPAERAPWPCHGGEWPGAGGRWPATRRGGGGTSALGPAPPAPGRPGDGAGGPAARRPREP